MRDVIEMVFNPNWFNTDLPLTEHFVLPGLLSDKIHTLFYNVFVLFSLSSLHLVAALQTLIIRNILKN
jgi:hypothetical protein